jgi:cytochrome c oxidase subunit 3
MFFVTFFWAFFHSSLSPTVEIGAIWPPKGIDVLNPWEIPFLNTLILLSSGVAVTWAYHAIFAGYRRQPILTLILTIGLGLIFYFSAVGINTSPFTTGDGIDQSICYLTTPFLGFSVMTIHHRIKPSLSYAYGCMVKQVEIISKNIKLYVFKKKQAVREYLVEGTIY